MICRNLYIDTKDYKLVCEAVSGAKVNIVDIYNYEFPEFLALLDRKKQLKGRHFSSHAEVIAAEETWLDGQYSEFFFLNSLQKLDFGRCSLFPS